MKKILFLLCCFVLLAGCTSQTQTDDGETALPAEPTSPGIDIPDAPDAVLEDRVLIDNENITVEAIDDVVEVDLKDSIDKEAASAFSFEGCVDGATYSFEQDGSTSDTILKGVVSYKGGQWCKGYSETTIQGFTIKTTYYFSEDLQEYWIVTDTMGQTQEMHIVN